MASAATMMAPFWLNLFENGAMVQFLHRWIGALLLLLVVVLLGFSFAGNLPRRLKVACGSLVAITLVQFLLGVFTLLNYVPIAPASAHQAVACLVLLVSIYLVYIVHDRRHNHDHQI
jgi:cytochrome c oxidase assembly protein subunit 15